MKHPYTRLPGRRWLVPGIVNQLWLGPDHLLAIARGGYTETYQRFDLRDVQALISRRSRRRLWLSLGLGLPAAIALIAGAALGGWGGVGAGLPFAGPLLLAVLANVLRGPTCVSHLRTAVSVVELPSLARVRSFERAVRVLRPLLEAAQGSLDPGALEERLAQLPPVPPSVRSARSAVAARPYRGAAHDVLFGLLIVLGLVGLLRAIVSAAGISAVGGALFAGVVIALVAALVRQRESDLAPGVTRVVQLAMAYCLFAFTLLYALMMVELMKNAKDARPDAVFRFFAGGAGTPAGLLVIALSLAGIGIGIAGALRLRAFRAARRAGVHTAPLLHP